MDPLVKGGQSRSAPSLIASLEGIGWAALLAAVACFGALMCGGCAATAKDDLRKIGGH